MKKTSKALLLTICAVLLVAASVMGTMAYLTSTDKVQNTFTVGKVAIKLDEAKVGTDGTPVEGADRVKENGYKLLPGHTYTKDPTVTVLKDSVESYVRLKVTLNKASAVMDMSVPEESKDDLDEGMERIFPLLNFIKIDQDAQSGFYWDCPLHPKNGSLEMEGAVMNPKYCVYDEEADTITYIFYYNAEAVTGKDTISAPDADVVIPALFESITVPSTATNEQIAALEGFRIDVVAEAIQADGFANADAAWAAFDA